MSAGAQRLWRFCKACIFGQGRLLIGVHLLKKRGSADGATAQVALREGAVVANLVENGQVGEETA